ncbi:hypothetical protein NKI56_20600 [Mesorhizobium sp. M0622]|uniref:hypothetical protein n=1 Tax=unclassified Mesorhizobium TaxID=325217 RepID=UPI003335974A
MLDEHFFWNLQSPDVKTLRLARTVPGDAADRERGQGAQCGGGDMVKVHCHRNSSLAANFPRRINNLGHFRFRFRQRGQQELVLFLLSLRREGSPIRRLSRG